MTDLYLKFTDEAQAKAVLAFAVRDGEWVNASHDWALDPVGIVTLTPGVYDEDGEVEPPVFADGWHVNIRVLTPGSIPDLSAYEVHPTHPRRVWA